MNFFVILTPECNLQCSYCHGKIWEEGEDCVSHEEVDCFLPLKIAYPIQKLADFCSKDKQCNLLLYGGEPLLELDTLKEIMDNVPAKSFLLQTNGMLLDKLPVEYLKKLSGLQVSIDGDRKTTDGYRGSCVYDAVVRNVAAARKSFSGELIARMTVGEKTDIFRSVTHLLELGIFDAVHWQVDANFGPDYKRRSFAKWAKESYNPGITKLVDWWLRNLERGKVYRIYPFLGVMQSLLSGEKSRLRCGAGWAHYAIQTDGNIVPCPVMAGMRKYYAGDLSSNPSRLKQFDVGGRCDSCGSRELCGGRCLFANVHGFWGKAGEDDVCGTVKHLLAELQRIQPAVVKLVSEKRLSFRELDYTEFNSCEIIP
jgi:putative peptide-modifying radical SAM enzyme